MAVLAQSLKFVEDRLLGLLFSDFGTSAHRLYPFVPMCRENEYTSLSPTTSGPVIEAVASSGNCVE
jgi:hypothetical protein